MQKKPSVRRKHGTVKVSVTVKRHLEHKYDRASLTKINTAIEDWIAADADRGIQTVHVAVDDPSEMREVWRNYFPKAPRVRSVSGKATPVKIKRVIDDLWERLRPKYLVLFGGDDVVPMFKVPNPTLYWRTNVSDWDRMLPTDNPYASSKAFDPQDIDSYLVPDRVIGRIPDMGTNWIEEGVQDLIYRDVAIDPANPEHIFAASNAGVFASTDGGLTWGNMSAGIPPGMVVTALSFNAMNRQLAASTFGRGVYMLELVQPHVQPRPTPRPRR